MSLDGMYHIRGKVDALESAHLTSSPCSRKSLSDLVQLILPLLSLGIPLFLEYIRVYILTFIQAPIPKTYLKILTLQTHPMKHDPLISNQTTPPS